MLTSSPIVPRQSSASPHTFHYAPSGSPHNSPKVTAALPRRHSKHSLAQSPSGSLGSLKSPSQTQPQTRQKQYVGVDAATQYSPMEPFDPTVPLRAVRPSAPKATPLPSLGIATPPAPVAAPSAPPPAPLSTSTMPDQPGESVLSPKTPGNINLSENPRSPAKRRNSQDLATAISSSNGTVVSAVAQSQSSSPKRSKTAKGPLKVLPLRYELCEGEDMVILIANMLSELIETNDSLGMKSGHLTRFHSRTAPGISVLDYLHRLAKHATLTPPLLLSMVYYIDRLCALYPDFTINTLTVHRFLITAATVAGKGLSDLFWNNSFYARVGGVKVAELKLLELEFLYRVDWRIVPNPEVLVAYYKGLVERCDGYTLEEDASPSVEADDEVGSDELDDSESDEALSG
ncbi:cyclin-domain-containing protein [Xylariales sp. PMI_506]|nr:cyclin-domain-containing protein [Xylariales sp. PMI_506]